MLLMEKVGWTTANIDEEAGIVRRVKVLGTISSNGRRYKEAALQKAVRLYEGMGVNVDHSVEERRVRDGFGRLKNVVFGERALWGDLEYLKTHPYTPQFLEAARRMPEQLGLSHVANGLLGAENGESVVEEIERVTSVDLVRYPATTKGLFESHNLERQQLCESVLAIVSDDSLSLDELRESLMATATDTDAEKKAAEAKAAADKIAAEKIAADKEVADKKLVDEKAAAEAAESQKKSAINLQEKVTALESKLADLQKSTDLMECISAHRIDMTALSEQQLTTLRSKANRKDMDAFAESLPDAARIGIRPYMAPRPQQGSTSYAQLRGELEESFNR